MYSNRVSKIQVKEILGKYLENDLVNKIYWEIVGADENDMKNVIGMTVSEWRARFDDDFELVWADDTNAGFGKRGDSVYGNSDDCVICRSDYDGKRYKFWVWCEPLTSETPFVIAAMKEHEKRCA